MLKILLILVLTSCSVLEKFKGRPYIDPWIGLPVTRLDSHTIFLTTPFETRSLEDGITVRSYKRTGGTTYGHGFVNEVVCHHLFYLKENKITDHKTVGTCAQRLPEN